MTNKVVNITIQKLDVTQLMKIRQFFTNEKCNKGSVHGAYNYELRELIDSILEGAYSNKNSIIAPDLTI